MAVDNNRRVSIQHRETLPLPALIEGPVSGSLETFVFTQDPQVPLGSYELAFGIGREGLTGSCTLRAVAQVHVHDDGTVDDGEFYQLRDIDQTVTSTVYSIPTGAGGNLVECTNKDSRNQQPFLLAYGIVILIDTTGATGNLTITPHFVRTA